MSLTFAASTDDASRRSTLLEAARDAARRGVAPKMAQVKPLMALELEEVDTTTVYQLAAATGDDEILSKLRTFFGSNTYSERLLAVRALPYSGDKGAAKTLSSSLFEGKSDMRIASARGLAVMGESSTLSAIQKALGRDRNPEVKLALIDALGAIGTTGALRILRFQTTTNDPKIKQAIIAAIRTSENKEGFKTLRSLLRDRDPRRALASLCRRARHRPRTGQSADVIDVPRPPPAASWWIWRPSMTSAPSAWHSPNWPSRSRAECAHPPSIT